jgi:hypothetical protein
MAIHEAEYAGTPITIVRYNRGPGGHLERDSASEPERQIMPKKCFRRFAAKFEIWVVGTLKAKETA